MKADTIRHSAIPMAAIGLLLAVTLTQAADNLTIEKPWVRATRPGQEVGAAYMEIRSTSGTTLVGVESPAAESVELHSMSMKNGVMSMRMLEELALPAGRTVKLEPGGLHLMLINLKQSLPAGGKVGFTLHFEDARGKSETVQLQAPVR